MSVNARLSLRRRLQRARTQNMFSLLAEQRRHPGGGSLLAWARRNGVALTVLLGLVFIGLIALAQSGLSPWHVLATASPRWPTLICPT